MLPSNDVTGLLMAWSEGDAQAQDKLMPLVYEELQQIASRYLRREYVGHTMQTVDLANEAYMKLVDQNQVDWKNRAHFFGIAANIMRRILIDQARSRQAVKRGGAVKKFSLDNEAIQFSHVGISEEPNFDLIELDDALKELAEFDPRQGKLVELRFFGGLSIAETAEVLEISPATVKREWNVAKAWLKRRLSQESNDT